MRVKIVVKMDSVLVMVNHVISAKRLTSMKECSLLVKASKSINLCPQGKNDEPLERRSYCIAIDVTMPVEIHYAQEVFHTRTAGRLKISCWCGA